MIATSLINGLFGFSIGYSEGTDIFNGGNNVNIFDVITLAQIIING